MTLIALNHHYVRPSFDSPFPGIHGVTPEELEAQLRILGSLGEFVSGEEIGEAVRGRHPLPERALVLTFDDGLREQYDHALPILERLGIPALFFVNTAPVAGGTVCAVHKVHLVRASLPPNEFARMLRAESLACGIVLPWDQVGEHGGVHYAYDDPASADLKYLLNFLLAPADRDRLIDRCFAELFGGREREIARTLYLDPDTIRELGRRGFLGTHAHDHLPLGLLPPAEACSQIKTSLDFLEQWAGRRPDTLSYPYGSREAAPGWVGAMAADLGIAAGFTMERAANLDLSTPLHLARYACNDLPGGKTPTLTEDRLFDDARYGSWFRREAPIVVS
jgi:peptidoglycan/xylan/chitin deacetylase (PgdA/CDA1 family)